MTKDQAAAFGSGDYLFFLSSGATAQDVQVAPFSNGASGSLTSTGIELTYGGKTLTFGESISTASRAGHILFNDASHLVIGTQGAETGAGAAGAITPVGSTNAAGAFVDPNTVYALGGGDTLTFTGSAAGTSNYLNGGFGADTITGGAGNNHIYGNSQFAQVGDTDPGSHVADLGDTITATTGTNYIQGNAGDDNITVGVNNTAVAPAASNASTGNNHVLGGADNDTITIQGAGLGIVNGNTGDDTITAATSTGDNTLRGGMGDDSISGGRGHDIVMGDMGSDTLVVHGETTAAMAGTPSQTHITLLTGGQGADTFDFSAAGAGIASTFAGSTTSGATTGPTYYQEITDFNVGEDHITLATNPTGMTSEVGHSATVFASVHDAEIFAQTQVGTGGSFVVSSLTVGSANNTYLFYSDAMAGDPTSNNTAGAGLGIIHLDNVDSNSINNASFQ
jgi:Ca2+-binding RTX toxin-like protein